MNNIITANLAMGRKITLQEVFQYNRGQRLMFTGVPLPQIYSVDFSNSIHGTSKKMIGDENGVIIPDEYFIPGQTIYAWLVQTSGPDARETIYEVRIPISLRARPTDEEPTPQQEEVIDQLIDKINDTIAETEEARDEAITARQAIEDMGVESETLPAGQEADVEKIVDPETGAVTLRFGIPEGKQGVQGDTGPYYIPSVSSDGTISWTNNGDLPNPESQNIKGDNGISPDVEVAQISGGHRVTITDVEGEHSFNVMDGTKGEDGVSPVVSVTAITGGHRVTIADAEGDHSFNVIDGVDGVSPVVTITNITGGHRVSITDATGTHEFDVTNGTDGENGVTFTPEVSEEGVISWTNDGGLPNPESMNIKGAPGQNGTDGISPAVSVSEIAGGHEVTITDAEHPSGQSFNVMDGQNGTPGEDGYSPSASVSKSGNTATITITDENGTTTASVTDGTDGVSPEITVENITGGHRITITDAEHPGGQSVDVMDGTDGSNGRGIVSVEKTSTSGLVDTYTITYTTGSPTTFTVTNGKDGDPGKPGQDGVGVPTGGTTGQVLTKASGTDYDTQWTDKNPVLQVSGTTPAIAAVDGTRYICGEVATLDISLPASGIVDVVFQSGSTAAVLTVTPPAGKTLSWANSFDPTGLEANTTYELNIAIVGDQCLGVSGAWT